MMYIAVSEFKFMTIMPFLETGRDGVYWKVMNYWRIIDRGGVLIPFNDGNYDHVTGSGFLSIVTRSGFDP